MATIHGAIAKRLCPGLQIRLDQFDSGSRLQNMLVSTFWVRGETNKICGNSSVGRAIPCQGIGRRFEPVFPLQFQSWCGSVHAGFCGNSSVGRAIPCQGIGRRFEPVFPLQHIAKRAFGLFFAFRRLRSARWRMLLPLHRPARSLSSFSPGAFAVMGTARICRCCGYRVHTEFPGCLRPTAQRERLEWQAACLDGEIGRHPGLKIPCRESGVPVRSRLEAPPG